MGELADKLIKAALGEWDFFGKSTRSLQNQWNIVGEEAKSPYRERIAQYWAAVGFPKWDGQTTEPWSGAFISWCFKEAGIMGSFNAKHSVYIDHIRRHHKMPEQLVLASPAVAIIEPGDLLWNGRDKHYPTPNHEAAIGHLDAKKFFLSHVDIVVSVDKDTCTSIGGNVSNKDPGGSVTRSTWSLKDGRISDPRKVWIGVVKNGF